MPIVQANTLWAYATLGEFDEALMQSVAADIGRKTKDLKSQHLVSRPRVAPEALPVTGCFTKHKEQVLMKHTSYHQHV